MGWIISTDTNHKKLIMKSLFEFIVQIENPFADKVTTENGNTFFINNKLSAKDAANRIGKVISVPLHHDTDIKEGFEVVIDPTILFEQAYALTHGTQDSSFLVDKEKGYYKVNPSLIVLYRDLNEKKWKGYLNNALFEIVKKDSEVKSEMIITDHLRGKIDLNKAKLAYGNKELLEQVSVGDTLVVDGMLGVDFSFENKQYKWFKNEDILGVLI